VNKKVTWTEEEDSIIKKTIDLRPRDIVKKIKNKNNVDIQKRRIDLGLKDAGRIPWEEEELKILINNVKKSHNELKLLLPYKNEYQISVKKTELKIYKNQGIWSDEDIEKLTKLSYTKKVSDIYKDFPDKSKNTLRGKYYNLKLQKNYSLNEEWPKQIQEWYHPELNQNKKLDEFKFSYNTNEISLKCENNHIFTREIQQIYHSIKTNISNKISCNKCAGVEVDYENSLEARYPNISKSYDLEKNIKKPSEISFDYTGRVSWICDKKHSLLRRPRIVTGQRETKSKDGYVPSDKDIYECLECLKSPLITEDLRFKKYISPNNNFEDIKDLRLTETNKKVLWLCLKDENHDDWPQTPYNLYRHFKDDETYNVNRGCLHCLNKLVTKENSLATKRPDISELINLDIHKDFDSNKVYFKSNSEFSFKCKNNPVLHKWLNSLLEMNKQKDILCPFCKIKEHKSGYRNPQLIRDLLVAIRDKLEFLTQQQKWVFFQQAGLLTGESKFVNFAKAIVSENLPISEIDKFIREEKSKVDKLIEDNINDESEDSESIQGNDGIDTSDFEEPSGEDDTFNLPKLKSKDVLKALSDTADLLQSDEDSIKYLIVSGKDTLWKDVFLREQEALKEIKSFTGNKYIEEIKNEFLNEYNTAKSFTLPKDYAFKKYGKVVEPNLMQWLVATRIIKNKRIGNFSGTGAGKTLSAVLAASFSNSKLIIITCPNAVCEGWDKEIKSIFPNTKTSIKGFDNNFKNYSGQKFLILNYEYFQQQDSADKVIDILNLGTIDFIIIDEIHYSKQRTAENISKRKEMIKNLVVETGNKNDDLKVLGMSATPVINNLYEGKTMIELITGKSYDDLETEPNVPNCMQVYQQLSTLGTRWLPKYDIQFKQNEIEINVDNYLDEIKEKVTKKNVLALEQILTKAKIPTIIENLNKKTVIYTHLVTGIVDVLREEITKAGYTVAQYTGEDKTGLKAFIEGDADVLIGSSSISTGVDGLQDVCQKIIVNILPWTNAEYEQLKGRVFRQGQTKPVEIVIPITNLNINGEEKSWCKSRLSRIKFKKTLADAAVDGIIPEENFRTEQQVLDDLMKWINRLSENKILAFDRKPLVSSLFTEDKKEINKRLRTFGDFSALNRKWNTGKSENTHKRLQENNEEWVHYHELYREARQSWVKTPYQELINYYGKRDGLVIGDFGCGEAKISEALKDKHKLHNFDHVAINEDVIECDISKTPLEDECLDVAIFSLTLMGSNFKDYIKEAYRTLKLDGRIHIIESASRFRDLEGFEKSLKHYGFDFITSAEMWKFTHIRGEKSTRPFNDEINISF